MINIKDLSKAFVFLMVFLLVGGLSVWLSVKFEVYWPLFLIIPILVLIGFILLVNSTVSAKCTNCGKEIGIRSGGLASIWLPEKPDKCQWCGHDAV